MDNNTLYLKGSPDKISEFVIFSGDPQRVEQITSFLDKVEKIAISREFYTYTGLYEGMPVTVTSTGIGAPSAAIAMEEMYECGMKVAVRLGTVMGLADDMLGKFVIPVGAVRDDGTTGTYVNQSYPAVADFGLVQAMNKSAELSGRGFINGIVASCEGFYSQMKTNSLARRLDIDIERQIEQYKKEQVIGLDMESSTILTLGSLMGIKACTVMITTVSSQVKSELDSKTRFQAEKVDLISTVLNGLKIYDKEYKGKEKK